MRPTVSIVQTAVEKAAKASLLMGHLLTLFMSPSTLNAQAISVEEINKGMCYNPNLTIYSNGLGLVKDTRLVSLVDGTNHLVLNGVPKLLLKDSILIKSLDNLPLIFTTISFRCDLQTFQTILDKSIGETVYILTPKTPDPPKQTGTLLSFDTKQALVKIEDRIEVVPLESVAFLKIPPSLSFQPALYVHVQTPQTQSAKLELTYLTKGLSWKTNYTVEVDPLAAKARIMGWVSVTNTSGVHFRKAQIQLASSEKFRRSGSPLTEKPNIYPISPQTSLYNDSTKEISFLSANSISAQKEYRIAMPSDLKQNYEGARIPLTAEVWYAFQNIPQNRLGTPLPPGHVKIYVTEKDQTRYAGSIQVKHTAIGESLHVPVDNYPSIEARAQQIDFKQLGTSIVETAFRVTLTNKGTETVSVLLTQKLPPNSIVSQTSKEPDIKSDLASWSVTVPKNETLPLYYRIKTMHKP